MLQLAILFTPVKFGTELTIMAPVKSIYGYIDSTRQTFYDIQTEKYYLNSDLLGFDQNATSVFNFVIPISRLLKRYKIKGIFDISTKYLKDMQKKVFFYRKDDFVLQVEDLSLFTQQTGINIKYDQTLIDISLNPNDDKDYINSKSISISKMNILDVYNLIRKRVIAQDTAIKEILTSVYRNYLFDDPKTKANILIYGPSGVGKTEILRTLGQILNIPVLIEDMTRYTSAGYKGKDLDEILIKLYYAANEDLELAQRSILVLDEIDKKADDAQGQNSFQKGDVLKSILKIIEGGVFDIQLDNEDIINFDTSHLTVICAGAFIGLEKENKTSNIGFTANPCPLKDSSTQDEKPKISQFIKYGMPLEFMGRIDKIVSLHNLSEDDLLKILRESEISPIKIYLEKLQKLGIDTSSIDKNDELYRKFARDAFHLQTGARALKLIVEDFFDQYLFEAFCKITGPQKKGSPHKIRTIQR